MDINSYSSTSFVLPGEGSMIIAIFLWGPLMISHQHFKYCYSPVSAEIKSSRRILLYHCKGALSQTSHVVCRATNFEGKIIGHLHHYLSSQQSSQLFSHVHESLQTQACLSMSCLSASWIFSVAWFILLAASQSQRLLWIFPWAHSQKCPQSFSL